MASQHFSAVVIRLFQNALANRIAHAAGFSLLHALSYMLLNPDSGRRGRGQDANLAVDLWAVAQGW
jgi:hypothetical protein